MSFGAVRLAIHPCGKPQGILATANKRISRDKCRHWVDRLSGLSFSPLHVTDPLESIRFKKLDQKIFQTSTILKEKSDYTSKGTRSRMLRTATMGASLRIPAFPMEKAQQRRRV
jgi:hypothetical protein